MNGGWERMGVVVGPFVTAAESVEDSEDRVMERFWKSGTGEEAMVRVARWRR